MSKSIGQILKEARERAGLSQSAFAKRVGMTQAQISRLESGERTYPGFDTMAKIASIIGESLDQIAMEAGLLPDRSRRKPSAAELHGMARRTSRARDLLKDLDKELKGLAARLDIE